MVTTGLRGFELTVVFGTTGLRGFELTVVFSVYSVLIVCLIRIDGLE